MKELKELRKVMSNAEIARRLVINRCNITMWVLLKRIPKKRILEIKELHKEVMRGNVKR